LQVLRTLTNDVADSGGPDTTMFEPRQVAR
jgi:hypothetical protein